MDDIPVSDSLARPTRNQLVRTKFTKPYSQTGFYDGTPQLLNIMPSIRCERASLVALVSSEAITTRHERATSTG